jgi:hypothetical protein
MALSDHEKRLLDEIEQTLRTQDPDLASSLRSARPRPRTRNLLVMAGVAFAAGIAVLFLGLRLASNLGTAFGVLGYLLIVAACDVATREVVALRGRRARGAM